MWSPLRNICAGELRYRVRRTCSSIDASRVMIDAEGTDQVSDPQPGLCGTSNIKERKGQSVTDADKNRRVEVYLVPNPQTMPPAAKNAQAAPADKLKVLPFNGDATAKDATVRTTVRKSDGSTVAVDYRLHKTDAGWKAWDVVIEGISYVKSFRDDFDTEIGQKGIDEVIKRLEAGDTPSAIKGASNGKKG